eukprot:264319-Prymnesium_polylepis.2
MKCGAMKVPIGVLWTDGEQNAPASMPIHHSHIVKTEAVEDALQSQRSRPALAAAANNADATDRAGYHTFRRGPWRQDCVRG